MTPVLCVPHAGAGASFFWPWRQVAPDRLTVLPVQLPGREELIDEAPFTSVEAAADGIVAGLGPVLGAHPEIAVFGHSLGAAIAFEVARRLASRPGTEVARLFVSGSPGPAVPRAERATGLDDDEFLARVEKFAGYRHPAFGIPELRDLILPTLRADVEMHEAYQASRAASLDVPITCFRGASDDLVSAAEAAGWQAATTASCEFIELNGGHMYLVEEAPRLLAAIAERLGGQLAAS